MPFVCITGMHRGGTSVLARAAHALGVDLGPARYLLRPDDDNPLGYWEDNRCVQLDDQLLGFLDGWWHQPPTLVKDWEYDWKLEPFRVWAAQLVADREPQLDGGGLSGFKDPRLCLLLPLWRTVVGIDHVLVSVRDPREVIASLARRDGFDPDWSARLWLRYTAGAIVNAPEALVVRYDDWFTDLDRTLTRIADHLAVPVTRASDEMRAFLSPDLRRSQTRSYDGDACARAVALYQLIESGLAAGLVSVMESVLAEPVA